MTPLKINDLTYVPVQSYAENLKLEAEVNGQAVKVNGMTLAMFGEDRVAGSWETGTEEKIFCL